MNRVDLEDPRGNTNGAAAREPWQDMPTDLPPGVEEGVRYGASDDTDAEPPPPANLDALTSAVTSEWLTETPPARRWLLRDKRHKGEGLLPLGKAAQLIAEGGAGKTMALIQLALAVATGGEWLGTFSVATKGRVLLVLGEEDAEEARRRIYAASRRVAPSTLPADSVVVLALAGHPCAMLEHDERGNPVETPFLDALRRTIAGGEWSLIVIDPLSRFAGLDAEKDNAEATRFVQACESICAVTGATVLVSHHTNKDSRKSGTALTGASSRGSSALHDGFRWQAALSCQRVETEAMGDWFEEVVTLRFTKSNYSRRAEDLLLRREEGGPLAPLDAVEREAFGKSKGGGAERAAKLAEKEAQRERVQAEREAKDAARRADREAEKATRDAERRAAEDRALRLVLEREPGLSGDKVIDALRAELGSCEESAGRTAIARAKAAGWVDIRIGAKGAPNARCHYLKGDSR